MPFVDSPIDYQSHSVGHCERIVDINGHYDYSRT
jgi:hypothetical protein